MACLLTKNRAKICSDSLGGVSKIYLFDFLENPFTVTADVCTAMNASLTVCYEYDLIGDENTFEQSTVGERANSTRVNTQTLNMKLNKTSALDNAEFNLLAASQAQAVVKDRNGIYHVLGYDDGLDWTIVSSSGGAKGDANGYVVTATGTTGRIAPTLDTSTASAFLAVIDS